MPALTGYYYAICSPVASFFVNFAKKSQAANNFPSIAIFLQNPHRLIE
jgi:hypothetical protein